jgi:parvulin-like peptidyl-prolyl isomerase
VLWLLMVKKKPVEDEALAVKILRTLPCNWRLAGLLIACPVAIASCSQTPEKTDTATGTATAPATTTSTTTTAADGTSKTTTATSTAGGAAKAAPDKSADKDEDKVPTDTRAGEVIPQIEAARKKIKLGAMPDTEVICIVANAPITIGEYRRQLKSREEEVQTNLSQNPNLRRQLLEDAKRNNITLTADEKQRLLETAKKAEDATGKALTDQLKKSHETMEKFNEYVLDLGLAFKDAGYRIEKQLLHQLVDRTILTQAARTHGYGPAAFTSYVEMKKGKVYEELLGSGFTADQLKDEIIANELVSRMIARIQKGTQASDADVEKFYKEHQALFKHGDLIRISQIVIAAPPKDIGAGVKSIRTQVHEQEPKLSGSELDTLVKLKEQEAKTKAQELLARALKPGADFAKLANENTDDIPSRAAKLGGDMDYQDKDRLMKEFADKVMPLKVGQVYPSLIPSDYGYHIIKVTGKKPAGVASLAEVKAKIEKVVNDQKADDALKKWLIEKRHTTTIVLSPEFQALVSADNKAKSSGTN